MANPVSVDLTTKNTYYKVATNVKSGNIKIKAWQPSDYMVTDRNTGEDAPTDDVTSWQVYTRSLTISNTSSIDVYMKCSKNLGNVIVLL